MIPAKWQTTDVPGNVNIIREQMIAMTGFEPKFCLAGAGVTEEDLRALGFVPVRGLKEDQPNVLSFPIPPEVTP